MATGSTDPTSRWRVTGSIPQNCSATLTQKRSAEPSSWNDAHFGYIIGHQKADLSRDDRDSAPFSPKCIVIDEAFTWGDDVRPNTPWDKTIIYEAHVKGLTQLAPFVPEELRGTYAGLRSPAVIEYFCRWELPQSN